MFRVKQNWSLAICSQVTSFTNFYKGDPYISSREEDIKKKNREIEEPKREVKALKAELSNNSGNSYRSRYVLLYCD